ncbi:MAG TPA: glycoside hydrolase/phage tail family protein [Hyphomonadaceae bacterium]|nr:glycoside hydrolase/phage tail family protein [Hyphomonadaceae bacterium]
MAELVLGKIGAAAGAALLPKSLSFVGGAVGRLAGAAFDARYLSPPVQGPRVKEFHLTEGREGAGIPIVYGRRRVGGQLIWAAEFKERRDVQGGKDGPRVAEYSYSLSFAVALCEGEIARVARCWANGEPLDLSRVTWRLYSGREDQLPDPLIEAIEGAGAAPAYRGVAYVVFEDMPVDQFGGRMPQLSFEIVRPAAGSGARLETMVRAINMIPGSGEFALSTEIVRRRIGPGREIVENVHGQERKSDFEVSLDQLEAELPNVARVNLVVSWFGSDLRAGECLVRPGVEMPVKTTLPYGWQVGGVDRDDAYVVSATDDRPNYGGTPSDDSVRQAVWMLKQRGYHVTLYPFLLMDVPERNGLPDPYGADEQAAFPWRGRIRASGGDPAAEIGRFFERYRSFVLHYAEMVGEVGADGILIGSELIGLTHQKVAGGYPAVDGLCELAADVRAVVGPDVEISYAADWTEYGAHVAGGDVSFPLDALWAHGAIDYVGLDWYPPMSDWRDGAGHADADAGGVRSPEYLALQVAGGEAFDWYYADDAGRAAQNRLAIADGAYGEPWVFRRKDVRGWWSHSHLPRVAGVRSPTPTAWVSGMKPVRFVEMGCPAVEKGANQPNVFFDPKSSESALPYFSDGSRDDLIQRRAIEAMHAFWSVDGNNPVSGFFDGRMVPDDGVAVWAWDARPYPAFPALSNVWGDADNWRVGHWLNGRTGLALLSDVVADIGVRAGVELDVDELVGIVPGYQFVGPVSARAALESLVAIYEVDATEHDGVIAFRMRGGGPSIIDEDRIVDESQSRLSLSREGMEGSDARVRLRFVDAENNHEPGVVVSAGASDADIVEVEAAILMDRGRAKRSAEALAAQLAIEGERAQFAMSADGIRYEAGDCVTLGGVDWRVVSVSNGLHTTFDVVRANAPGALNIATAEAVAQAAPLIGAEPHVVIVDAPPLPGSEDDLRPIGFAIGEPWTNAIVFSAGPDLTALSERGRIERPCAVGELVSSLSPHVSGRWLDASVWVRVGGGTLSSRDESAVLNGANIALVETDSGWEMIQYQRAELVDDDTYRLSGLLRGQQGSEVAMGQGADSGATIVFLSGAETRLELSDWERGLELLWRAGPESGGTSWEGSQVPAGIGVRPWSPCHLAASWQGADLAFGWIRRARKGGDSWMAGEPAQEGVEAYRIRVSGGGSVREWDVSDAAALYTGGDRFADFPAGGSALVEVAQLAANGQPGDWAWLELTIPAP